MENIKITNDHKDRFQSFEAKIDLSGGDGMGHYDCQLESYGADESEAKTNLAQQLNSLIATLNTLNTLKTEAACKQE